jgi:hypothetical protein
MWAGYIEAQCIEHRYNARDPACPEPFRALRPVRTNAGQTAMTLEPQQTQNAAEKNSERRWF